jgi:hypothetical protein
VRTEGALEALAQSGDCQEGLPEEMKWSFIPRNILGRGGGIGNTILEVACANAHGEERQRVVIT